MEELKQLGELNRMGKSWFVLYKYYEVIDHNERDWVSCSTVQMRKNVYERTREYHADWLKYIANICGDRLNSNQFGKSGSTINKMAKEIYDTIYKKQ